MSLPKEYLKNPLFVFALEMESDGKFTSFQTVHTGVGKVQAAYALGKAIVKDRPSLVVNLGSAGSAVYDAGQVVCCKGFVQRDMDVTPLGIEKYVTPFSDLSQILKNGIEMKGCPSCICGTGDSFETAHTGEIYDIVDMEAYALALICLREDIPFLSLKYISDGANGAAAKDWGEALKDGAIKLHREITRLFKPEKIEQTIS